MKSLTAIKDWKSTGVDIGQRSREPLAFAEQHTVIAGDAEFEALGDETGAFHEVVGGIGAAQFARCRFEQRQPAVESLNVRWFG